MNHPDDYAPPMNSSAIDILIGSAAPEKVFQ